MASFLYSPLPPLSLCHCDLPFATASSSFSVSSYETRRYLDLRFAGRRSWRRTAGTSPSVVVGEVSLGKGVDRELMLPPFNVLITGSSKGIGFALARKFLEAGDNVLICSRSAERVKSAVQKLKEETGEQRVWGIVCDVRDGNNVKKMVASAREKMNYVDIWINNAGSNAYSYKPLAETSDDDLMEVVTTNTLGLMICCREAIKMMLGQSRGGHVFNIDGAGSDGRPTPRFAAYGATKRSVVHLTKSLQAELQMNEVKNVMVHNLSPGMVTTDLLMSGATTKQAKFFINILAEPPEVIRTNENYSHRGNLLASIGNTKSKSETDSAHLLDHMQQVADYLVPCVRSVASRGSMRPTYIRFLTGLKAYSQIFSRLAFGARRNKYVIEED